MNSTLRFQLFIRDEHNSDASEVTFNELQKIIQDLHLELGHLISRIVLADVYQLSQDKPDLKKYQRVDIYSPFIELRADEVCKIADFIAFHYNVDVEAIAL